MTLKCSFILALALSVGGGCSPIGMAKRGLTELKGASGKVVPVREARPAFYQSLGTLRIGSVSNTIAPVCPPRMHALVETALKGRAAATAEDLVGSRTCTAEVEIIYHQPPGGVTALVGKGALLLGRARLLDEQQELQADLLIGVFSSAVRTTEDEMATTFAKTLTDHVVERAH